MRRAVKKEVGKKGFDKDGDMKLSAIKKVKKMAKRRGDTSMEDAADESFTLKKLENRRWE